MREPSLEERPCRGVIFDLDDTLFDCTGQLTSAARLRASEVLAPAVGLPVADLCRRQEAFAGALGSLGALRQIAREAGLPQQLVDRALGAYNQDVVEAIVPYPDVCPTLAAIDSRGIRMACVTTGRPERQRAKIRVLGLGGYFSEKAKTLFLHDPDLHGPDKSPILSRAAAALGADPCGVFVVGDKLESEIAAGNRLGMTTVHIRRPGRPGVPKGMARYEIDRLGQLLPLLGLLPLPAA